MRGRVMRWLDYLASQYLRALAGVFAGVALGLGVAFYYLYRGIAFVHDRGHERKRAGVLRIFEPAPTSASSETVEDADNVDEYVLGYAECAYTGFYPEQEDSLPSAIELLRSPKQPAWEVYDRLAWDGEEPYRDSCDPPLGKVPLGRALARTRRCMYCGVVLARGTTDDFRLREREFVWRYETSECFACGWWCVSYRFGQRSFAYEAEDYQHAYAVMRRFDPFALDTPLALAREYLARNPHKLSRFDPFRFEALMAACIGDYFGGDCQISLLGGRKDKGIDIKAVQANGLITLIQVKRHADFSKGESVQTVRDLHGVMLREQVFRGMIVSTARRFSPDARDEVARVGRNLSYYSMELLPLSDVVDLLGKPAPRRRSPWEAHGIRIDQPEPSWGGGEDWIDRSALPHLAAQSII